MEPIRVLHNIVLMDAGGIETLVMNLYRHIDKEQILFDFRSQTAGGLLRKGNQRIRRKSLQNPSV